MRMPGQSWLGAAATFLGMWVVMMVAMMLPALVPMLRRYRTAVGAAGERRLGRRTALVGAGYFVAWTLFGVALFPLGVALAAAAMELPTLARAVPIAVGAVVLIAGALQFTTWKATQLACCRDGTVGIGRIGTIAIGATGPTSATAAWRHGLRLGVHCIACCLGPTAILLVLGVMDLRAMAVVTAIITLERLAPAGERVARALGAVVVAAGLFLMAQAALALPLLALAAATSCTAGGESTHRADVLASDGVPIVWESHGHGESTLVLIHCWCGNRSFWKNQVDELARDHQVITFDLPGHGESGHDRAQWSVDGLGADVAHLADELHLQHMILLGHSMGGPVALSAAVRMRGRVDGIVAIDTLHDADNGMTREQVDGLAKTFEKSFDAGLEQVIPTMLAPDADPALKRWLIDQAGRTDQRAALALMRDFPNLDLPTMFKNARVPIRGINSANSPWPTNVAANRKYADYDAIVLKEVGHYLHLEKPAEFNAALQRTLAGLERRAK
jgi:predicted metal-binding membrane protein/pimeloyl-ACP methyl ester carboxylesterase